MRHVILAPSIVSCYSGGLSYRYSAPELLYLYLLSIDTIGRLVAREEIVIFC